MLTKKQAYLAAFHYLDKLYDIEPNEALGDLLSSMNPYLFGNSNSADPATWLDWEKCINGITASEYVSKIEAYQAMIAFLQFNQTEFGYDLAYIFEKLNSQAQIQKWLASVDDMQ